MHQLSAAIPPLSPAINPHPDSPRNPQNSIDWLLALFPDNDDSFDPYKLGYRFSSPDPDPTRSRIVKLFDSLANPL